MDAGETIEGGDGEPEKMDVDVADDSVPAESDSCMDVTDADEVKKGQPSPPPQAQPDDTAVTENLDKTATLTPELAKTTDADSGDKCEVSLTHDSVSGAGGDEAKTGDRPVEDMPSPKPNHESIVNNANLEFDETETLSNGEINFKPVIKDVNLPEGCTDSSQSSSSEMQLSAVPGESSCSSHENNSNSTATTTTTTTDFENAISGGAPWGEFVAPEAPVTSKPPSETTKDPEPSSEPVPETKPVEKGPEPAEPKPESSETGVESTSECPAPVAQAPSQGNDVVSNGTEAEEKAGEEQEEEEEEPPPPPPPPVPRKRGRPRKQVLPAPSPTVEFGQAATPESPSETKRSTRSERRSTKRKFEEEDVKTPEAADTPKRRYTKRTPVPKKTPKRQTYIPKRRGPIRKKQEMENIQNFEEETRMSASEDHGRFSSKSGAICDDSQSSFITEGHTRSNINKKGRMEVMTDGCKPVTVQQIVEYHWPPPSSTSSHSHSDKTEGLMIQEQITEYLGVKSFKRKYPSIKRRPVDMEERNYLQENGFVSENMCDMGLTAVYAADIIEIMYNDFPQKFEEYRKYTREKKAKEQRALREKQAAERADMDPQKEAVESAQSWNSEFNKTRRFRVLHWRPEMREFTEGLPCPPGDRIAIYHAPSNVALCLESGHWSMSFFSYECEISGHTKALKNREIDPTNTWAFIVGSVPRE